MERKWKRAVREGSVVNKGINAGKIGKSRNLGLA